MTKTKFDILLERREQLLNTTTTLILKTLQPILNIIQNNFKADHLDSTNIEWSDVIKISDVYVLIGYIPYQLGTILTDTATNTEFVITEDNIEEYKSYIKLGIPGEILFGDTDKLISYLQNDIIVYNDEEHFEEVMENLDNEREKINGFDLDQLTPEQQESLKLFSKINKPS